MNVDDTLLMAYVDDDLPAGRRAEVEKDLFNSAEMADRLAVMRASVQPYKAAFDHQALPLVPPDLKQRIEELAARSAFPSEPAAPARHRVSRPWLAAAFVAGAFISGVAVKLSAGQQPGFAPPTAAPPWIGAVATYQNLYSRRTLMNVTDDPNATARIVRELRDVDGFAVKIPDLGAQGLAFKRIQRLQFKDRALVQIVYLPQRGEPVALCIVQDARQDEAMHAQKLGDMNTVAWRRGRSAFALLSKDEGLDLADLARRISSADTAPLYGGGPVGSAPPSNRPAKTAA
ncbi:MAG: anti-sigma factor [Burkholderiaceae bacterium]